MKKRMFITTIVMMLVLAVALTTSSLAWFSSANTAVTASAATFTATSSGDSNVNLKISDSTGSWGNQIALTSAAGRSMIGMIPQSALVATTGTAPTFTGVTVNGAHVDVVHGNYVWPARMSFNSAKIGDESNFVIEADAAGNDVNGDPSTSTNKVSDYSNVAVNGSAGYYYDEFYLHNADAQSVINTLNFQVRGSLSKITGAEAEGSDYTCNGYAAFIVFDAVAVAVGETVPTNALESAGYTVIAYGTSPAENQVAAASDDKYLAWVPFAAFTIAMDKTGDTGANNSNVAWQFGNLDEIDGSAFRYNSIAIENVNTQAYDAISGDTGFTLSTANLKLLNDKVVNGEGNVTNSNTSRDTTSVFTMPAGETYRVAFYFWLDGYTMTSFTDTTVAEVSIRVSAAQ
ncbi:MAG: hypothetical protein IJS93_01990 [Clostridia bacterium]|nr:hypothetical protein [Clostridia bacterium]